MTEPNELSVFRCYSRKPQRDPEASFGQEDGCDSPEMDVSSLQPAGDPLRPFANAVAEAESPSVLWSGPLNPSEARILAWKLNGSGHKSAAELDVLVKDVICTPDFDKEHFANFTSTSRLEARLDEYVATSGAFSCKDGWKKDSVKIKLPKEGHKFASEAAAPVFEVQGVWHRSLLKVIKSTYQDDIQASSSFHCVPHQLYFVPPSSSAASTAGSSSSPPHPSGASADTSGQSSRTPCSETQGSSSSSEIPPNAERMYSETYNTNHLLAEDEKIREMPRHPDDSSDVEYCVAPCTVWSDSTHLTNFRTKSLWPVYLYPGSLSKYVRS